MSLSNKITKKYTRSAEVFASLSSMGMKLVSSKEKVNLFDGPRKTEKSERYLSGEATLVKD